MIGHRRKSVVWCKVVAQWLRPNAIKSRVMGKHAAKFAYSGKKRDFSWNACRTKGFKNHAKLLSHLTPLRGTRPSGGGSFFRASSQQPVMRKSTCRVSPHSKGTKAIMWPVHLLCAWAWSNRPPSPFAFFGQPDPFLFLTRTPLSWPVAMTDLSQQQYATESNARPP